MSYQEIISFAEAPFEIIDGDRGKNYPKQSEFSETGYCLFLSATNVTKSGFDFATCQFIDQKRDEALNKGKLRREDIVLTTRGTIGNTAYFNEAVPFDHLRINSGMVILRCDPSKLLPAFLYHFVRSPSFFSQVNGLRSGVAQPQLPIRDMRQIKLPLPPLSIQQRMAGILSAYDELIENSQRRIKILESMARALYREWFVHFRFPGHESVPRVPSPLGEIPKGWELATFAQAAVFENGDRGKNYPNGSDFVAEGIPFINAGHLVDGAVNLADMNYIAEEKFGQLRSGKIRMGDLLFCLRGSPGRTARTTGLRRGAIASSLVIIRPTERSNEAFLFYTLVGEIGKQMAIELDNGATQPNVSVGSVQKYPLLLPPMNLLDNFEISIDPIWKQMEILRDQLSNLRRQRDLLLPRLLSGQIDLEDIAS